MPREEFQRELDALRDDILRLGEVVVTRLRKAVTALEEHDVSLAERIADADHEINELYLDLESDCIELFALQQPVASDLRFVAASFKILTDLERIADLAATLAMYAIDAHRTPVLDADIADLATTAIEMVEDALSAYADSDADACFEIADRDDRFDRACQRVVQSVIRDLVDRSPETDDFDRVLGEVTRILLTVRDLERVGDHAVNIAARTLYVVESDDTLIY